MSYYMNQYQHAACETAEYASDMYPIVSLIVEAAELADLFVKPRLRGDNNGVYPPREEIVSEAGDVLWNLANLLRDQGITLEEVADYNLRKVNSRKERGNIQGNGGNR